ncbi:hypothetical protein AUEXF2481DRAFT_33900 [Aureobasidium subglaciale EXF-2481]|uniref:Amidase domain-containing protein n=1 Tax=Aureobasidium subglaciale (strain EXF-2481) TaxID=1043005 RepID=A0A074Y8N3_AURSE|nr:uncharacterized protein AUEXF2481DRAFT_33900 [Aureobasidium subglaciale EXF-2481]KEQ90572.1 hypothetical protein AUEXF2481DRAFT_33900 [Aureobasidium subglaciale EXF-2481]
MIFHLSLGQHNNVVGAPADWNDNFLLQNKDVTLASLGDASPDLIFPLPTDYVPLRFAEVKNLINYPALAKFIKEGNRSERSIHDIPEHNFDAVVFPAASNAGKADLEQDSTSAEHALLNGVRYSNGNRALRHLGVPTVSMPIGILESKDIPVNLTLYLRAGADAELLSFVYAYEQGSTRR